MIHSLLILHTGRTLRPGLGFILTTVIINAFPLERNRL